MKYIVKIEIGVVFRGSFEGCKQFIKELPKQWIRKKEEASLYSDKMTLLQRIVILKEN